MQEAHKELIAAREAIEACNRQPGDEPPGRKRLRRSIGLSMEVEAEEEDQEDAEDGSLRWKSRNLVLSDEEEDEASKPNRQVILLYGCQVESRQNKMIASQWLTDIDTGI